MMERDIYGRFKSNRREEPKWTGVATVVGMVPVIWALFGWEATVAWTAVVGGLFAFCVWIDRRKR